MKIQKANDIKNDVKVMGMIYGQPGVGKSTLALSFPSPLLIDCDRGVGRVQNRFRADTVTPESLADLDFTGLEGYETIVFDTLGALLDLFDNKIKQEQPKLVKDDGALTLQGYGARKILFNDFLAKLKKLGKNIVFVAHEKEDKDGDIRIVRPEVSGSAANDVIKMLDFVGYMEMRGDKRSISFTPSAKFYAKNSLNLPRYIEVPETIDKNTFMTDVVIKGTAEKREKDALDAKKYGEVIGRAMVILSSKKTLEEKTAEIMALDHIFDSKLRTWKALEQVADGKKWDKEAKKWQ